MEHVEVANKGYGFTHSFNSDELKRLNWSGVLPADLSEYQIPDGLEDWQKACYVGATADYVGGAVVCEEDFYIIKDCLIQDFLLAAIGVCFEKMYDFPKDSIRSLEDYNGDKMFFLCIAWPPKEYDRVLSKLTQDSFLKMINEFLSKLCTEKYTRGLCSALEMCEEYTECSEVEISPIVLQAHIDSILASDTSDNTLNPTECLRKLFEM